MTFEEQAEAEVDALTPSVPTLRQAARAADMRRADILSVVINLFLATMTLLLANGCADVAYSCGVLMQSVSYGPQSHADIRQFCYDSSMCGRCQVCVSRKTALDGYCVPVRGCY